MDKSFVSTVILGTLLSLTLIGIIILLVVASNMENVPNVQISQNIDIILFDIGRYRTPFQVYFIELYMPWVATIIVVKTKAYLRYTVNNIPDSVKQLKSSIPIVYLEDIENDTMFSSLVNLRTRYKNVSNDIIVFGDTTVPTRNIKLTEFWSASRKKRLFNYIQPDARMVGLNSFFEDTFPVVLITLPDLEKAFNLDALILSLSLCGNIVHSPSINKSIVFTKNDDIDYQQLDGLISQKYLFTSFFISPLYDQSTCEILNQRILDSLLLCIDFQKIQ